jgi:hypothetical protein
MRLLCAVAKFGNEIRERVSMRALAVCFENHDCTEDETKPQRYLGYMLNLV